MMSSVKGRTIASRWLGDGLQDLKSRKGFSWDNTILTFQTSEQRPGLRWWCSGKESTCQSRKHGFDPWVGKIPWRRKWQPTPVFLPGKPPRTEEPGLWGQKRVGHNLVTKQRQQKPRVKRDLAWCFHSHLLPRWAACFLVQPPDDGTGAYLAWGAGRASCSDIVGLCLYYQWPKCNLRWNLCWGLNLRIRWVHHLHTFHF